MNILVIDDDREKFCSIFKVFEDDPDNAYYYFEAPDNPGEDYLAELVGVVKEESISAILSLTYYQFISLACGILQIPYLCWIVKGYEEKSFDKTIQNPWNHIFCADYGTYELLEKAGLHHISFLPLSYAQVNHVLSNTTKDILFVTDDIEDFNSAGVKFDLLKDASKGYLDGVLNAKKADLRNRPFFDNSAVYFRDDLKKCYPLSDEDFEPEGHRYDYSLLLPLLDNKAPHIMLFHITASWVKEDYKVDVLTKKTVTDKVNHERITYYSGDSVDGKAFNFSDYKIIIYFPRYQEKDIVTEKMLEIMASNSLLLLPGYVHERLLIDSNALFFKNRYELAKLIEKYLFDEEARMDAVRRCNAYAKKCPTYEEAMNTILKEIDD